MNQLLRDVNIQPTDKVIAEGLGDANTVFVKFVCGLEKYGITLMEWRYYNDGKAWLNKGEKKIKKRLQRRFFCVIIFMVRMCQPIVLLFWTD